MIATTRLAITLAVLTATAVAGCSSSADRSPTPAAAPNVGARVVPPTPPVPSSTPALVSPSTTSTPAPSFRATINPIDEATRARMKFSWRPGCPVAPDALRLLELTFWGFDGVEHEGELVVAADYAEDIVAVFRHLHEARFRIQQLRLVDEFGGNDDRSMAANNTSGFNCRRATGSDRWSEHAYGRAIDINPIQNPYVTRAGSVLPPAGAAHTTRNPATYGLITADGPVVAAFARIGWVWGGRWSSGKDYQHFSATGR